MQRSGTIFIACCPLVLASGSPRRRAFFADLGLAPLILPAPDTAEPAPRSGERPEEYAVRAATAKALAVLRPGAAARPDRRVPAPDAAVLGADTIVVLDNVVLGKPRDPGHALDMLRALNGRTHTVITGCALLHRGGLSTFHEATSVTFVRASDALLRGYVAGREPMDKAGAYAIQGKGAFLVASLTGSWTNVVGLPLSLLVERLTAGGIIRPA